MKHLSGVELPQLYNLFAVCFQLHEWQKSLLYYIVFGHIVYGVLVAMQVFVDSNLYK